MKYWGFNKVGGQDRTRSIEGIFFLPLIRRYFYFSMAFNFPEGLHGVVGVSRFLHFTRKVVFLMGLMGSFSCFHIITTLLLFELLFFFWKLLFATLNFWLPATYSPKLDNRSSTQGPFPIGPRELQPHPLWTSNTASDKWWRWLS